MLQTVEEEHEALIQFLYMAPIGLVQLRADGEITMVNPLCAQLLMPLSRSGSMSNLFVALEGVAPDLRNRAESFPESNGTICDAMHLHVDTGRSGRRDTQVLSLSLLKLDAERLMAVLSDVTQTVRRERELRQGQAWIHSIVTGLTDYALVSLDENGRCESWNPSIERVTGFTELAIRGQSYAMFSPLDDTSAERVLDRLHEADCSGWSLDEGWRLRADGTRYWGSCLIAPLHEPGQPQPEGRAYSLIIRDVSDRREATDAIRRSLSCDHLTGLSNRRVLYEAAEVEFERWHRTPRPLSVVMIDADHFKQVNDRYGHATGDAVLRHLATALTATFGPMGTIARVGGEEFVALLPGITVHAAAAAAERLCRTIEGQAVTVGEQSIRYTVSAGVAGMEAGVAGVDALIQRADIALYDAKESGRNRVGCWDSHLPKS
ncbi:MAG: sensor domain-containing diguanylate cyclase [Pseudomonas sp.]|uniref:sensor domain-containing diguanylate cyclase n=1 Tax=Pseudomonas sp. TaxID=306 RepID=UPI0011FDCF49|nr:sensor domain-containing diguanylate cyclase [Pseudomonas sp.]RZI69930.1 MAG: sensor domain-containing diguanylate cyclase [Pseudomonas sp.]